MNKALLVTTGLVGLLFAASPALAQATDVWTGLGLVDNNWDTGLNWLPIAEPSGTDTVQITDPLVQSVVNFQNPASGTLTSVTVDGGMTLQQNQDTLSTNALNIGNFGTYTLSGSGTLQAGSVSVVGNGVVNVGSPEIFAASLGSSSISNASIGGGTTCTSCTLNAGTINLGSDGTVPGIATMNQYGGTVNDDLTVGDASGGSYTNNNGTHNVTGNLILGNQSTGSGSYTITGSSAQTNVNFAGTPGGSPPETPNGALIVGNAGTGSFTQETFTGSDTTPAVNVAGDLALGLQSGSTGTYTLNDGTLTVGGVVIVGAGSTNANQFTQNGGTVTLTGSAAGNSLYAPVSPGAVPSTFPGTLFIGGESVFDNGTGTYTLTGGNLNAPTIEVGFSGTGTVNQSGGAVTAGYIDLGGCGGCNGGNSAGFYNLTGTGTIVAGAETVGDVGHGEFVQGSDGLGTTVNTVNGELAIGNSPTATPNVANSGNYDRSGTYTLDSGTLNTQYTVVGSVGTGAFIQNGGTHAVTNTLTIGQQNSQPLSGPAGSGTASNPVFGGPAPGTYTMMGGILTANGDQSVGNDTSGAGIIVGDAGNGTFNQIGGSVTSGVGGTQRGNLLISAQAGSTGTYNLGDSTNGAPTLQVYGDATIGRDAAGSVTVPDGLNDGGTVTVPLASSNGTLTIAGNGTAMSVNQYTGFDTRNGGNMLVGLNGIGAVTQTDASTLFTDHNLVLGANAGSSGSFTLNATSLGGSQANLFVGSDLNIGGMTSLTDIYGFNLQTTVNGGTGTFNLQSGDVATAGAVNVGNNDGTGALTISGGTLAAGNGMNIGVNDFTINNDTGGIDRSGATGGGSGTVTQTAGAVTVGSPTNSTALNLGTTANALDPTTGTYTITGASSLDVYGNVDIGVSTGATGTMTIGSGSDSPTVNIHSTGVGDGNLTVADTGTGNLTVHSGALSIDGGLSIGVNGTGTVTQTGGTVTTSIVDMTTPVGSGSASYTISGGTLHSTGDLNVGGAGAGPVTFSESGDPTTVNVDGTLRVGNLYNTGSYTLSGGTLNVGGDSLIGNDSLMGTMDQSDGSHLVNGTLTLGDGVGSSGLYTLSGGALTTGITHGSSIGDVVIGSSGTGELDNSGGIQTSESTAGLTLGFFGGSQGTYKLTGTGSLSVAGNENVGVFGTGIFQQGDGSGTTSNTVGGSLYISSGFGGPASSYTLTDGTLTVTGSEVVGFAAQGSFTQSGGTNNANGGLTVGLLSNAPTDAAQFGNGTYALGGSGTLNVGGDLVLGSSTGTSGTFNHNTAAGDAGSLSFTGSGQNLVVGDAGTGVFNEGSASNTTDLNLQTSGTTLDIGRSVGGNGTFNLAAGSSLEDDMIVGDAGTGVFNNSGGTNTVGTSSVPVNLVLGNQSTGTGTYNNNGGNNTVNGNLVVGGAGTGSYNLGNATTGADLQVQGTGLSGGNVFVGETGTGTITASSGSVATIAGGLILGGPSPGETTGNGTLTVTGFGTEWTNEGQTQIGGAGTGTLNVLAGGYFESHTGGSGSGSAAALGSVAGSTGTATVDGTNSEWNLPDGALRVGVSSTGSGNGAQGNLLTISNGGEVIDNDGNSSDGALTDDGAAASVGWKSGSVGTVNVVTGGTWFNGGDLVIGDAGTGTVHLDNSSGSNIAVGGNLILGNLASGNGTLNLDNAGLLTLNSGTQFIVGNGGTGVVNQNGGNLNLTTAGVTLDIGAQVGSNGTYNLNGGSLEDDLTVGNAGTGTFNNTGMTHTVTGSLTLGNQSTGNGTYNLTDGGTTTVSSFTTVGAAGTGTFLNDASTHTTQVLVLGTEGGANGTYTLQNGGTLTVGTSGNTGFLDVGEHGTGIFNQTSGTTTVFGALDLGRCGNATGCLGVNDTDTSVGSGTVNLSGGSLSVSQFAVVGDSGTGLFAQSGGSTVTVGTELDIGRSGGNGTYTIADTSSLTITTGDLVVGAFGPGGSGTLTQTGGTVTVSAGDAVVGDVTGVTGTYTLSGPGTLSISGELYVGAAGNGTFTQSGTGSSVTATALSVGNDQDGVGSYNLSAGLLTINGNTYLGGGVPSPSQGTITQTGGTAALNGDVNVGYASGGTGTYTIGGSGAATIAGNLDIGVAAGSTGTLNFNQGGGSATLAFTTPGSTMTVGDGGSGTVNQGGGDLNLNGQGIALDIGAQQGSNGHYNLTGGTLEDDLVVGDAGTGTFSNTGGVHTVSGNLIIGNQPTGNGTYTLGGTGNLTLATTGAQIILGNAAGASGTFNFNTAALDAGTITFSGTGDQIIVGNSGSGVLTQGGGDLNLTGAGASMDIAANANSFGQVNLQGGTLETGALNVGDAGSGQFNQSGGTATITGNLVAGNQTGSSGTVSIGPGSLTVTGNATIGNTGSGSFGMGTGATVDVEGSMTIANSAAGGSAAIEGGALTIGNGGSGNQLLITSNGSMKIEDSNGAGASVTVDGTLVNNGQLALGLHDVTPSATLTATQGFQNNGSFNFEANSVVNANVTNGSATNTSAYFSAQNGASTQVTLNGNMDNFAGVNVSSLGGAGSSLTQTGNFTNESTGTLTVIGSNLTINGSGTALDNSGSVVISEDVNGPTAPISTVAITGNVKNETTGTITMTDANVTVTGNVDNFNQITAQRDAGNVNVASNVTVTGTLTNESNATLTLSNSAMTVDGAATNNGTVDVNGSTAHWNSTFTNNGAYHSDPSTSYFADLAVGTNGYLTGSAGDVFNISGKFTNTSTQNTLWSTSAATLEFSGSSGTSHTMDLVGLDEGPVSGGFTNNYAWGLLDLDSGNSLSLDGTAGTNALYAAALEGLDISGDDITNIFGDGMNIYYNPADDAALDDLTYALENGGFLCPIGASTCTVSTSPPPPQVPEPDSLLLLGSGLVGFAFLRRRMARSKGQASPR